MRSLRSPKIPRTLCALAFAILVAHAVPAAGEDGQWVQISTAHSPGSRSYTAYAYDPFKQRMLIFGGDSSGVAHGNEVWQLKLTGTSDWTLMNTSGTAPGVRDDATAVFDPIHNQLVIYGGTDASGYLGDVWALSLGASPTWSKLADGQVCPVHTAAPCPRGGHAAVWNSNTGTMWISCGTTCATFCQDVWAATPTSTSATWASLGGSHPCDCADCYTDGLPRLRSDHSMIYDSRNRAAVICGGDYDGSFPPEAWRLSSGIWNQLSNAPPGALVGHTAVYDSVRARMLVFGGNGNDGSVFALNLMPNQTPSWATLNPCGSSPGGMSEHAAIFDAANDRMVVFTTSGTTYALNFRHEAPISDLTAKSFAAHSVYMRWTAPLDSTACGQAASYDLRYSTSAINTDADFAAATQVSGDPTPSPPGQLDSLQVGGLTPSVTYYLAIKTSDHDGTVSALSDVYSICWLTSPLRLCGGDGAQEVPNVEPGPSFALAIGALQPNPARGSVDVAFTLPRAGDAQLDVIDVAGRLVQRRAVGGFGAGAHSVRLGNDAPLPPGFLVVRLTQGGTTATRSVIVVR